MSEGVVGTEQLATPPVEKPSEATVEKTSEEIASNGDAKPAKEESRKVDANSNESVEKVEEKGNNEEEKNETKEEPKKKTLPKWMVQSADDANDEVVKEEEAKAEAVKDKEEPEQPSPPKKRSRRKVDPVVAEAEKSAAPLLESRPRRSTRSNIDYANPDASTVIAEIDDEEPGGAGTGRRGSRRGRPPASGIGKGRGRKRKSDDSDAEEEDDDGDDDYKGQKTKRGSKSGPTGRRGRPPTNKKTPAKRGRKAKNAKESDDDDEEIELDDHESENEKSGDEADGAEGEEKVASPPKRGRGRKPVAPKTDAPAKRRGRPPRNAAKSTEEAKEGAAAAEEETPIETVENASEAPATDNGGESEVTGVASEPQPTEASA